MLAASEKIIIITTCAYYSFYFYITGIICCCVIERLVATIMMNTYEHNRRWFPVMLSQPFASYLYFFFLRKLRYGVVSSLGFQITLGITSIFMGDEFVRALSTLAFYLLNILGLIVLLFVNYRITRVLAGSGASLTTRYQITENIRTIRVLLPAVIFDSLVSITDILAMICFDLNPIFDEKRCTEDYYVAAFYGFTTTSAVLEFLIPISLLFSHPVYRRQSVLMYERELMRISSSSVKDKTLPKVVVLEGKTKKLVRKNGVTHLFTAFKLDKTLNVNLAYALTFGDQVIGYLAFPFVDELRTSILPQLTYWVDETVRFE
ncbi:unnamed protein product [Angiostrongylus costaricensis]|uniref:Serpentine receptor class gamma n=1 Tax=Angiostrongylus costaricensis TaxID=334426 RepID=A0A158PDJ1_ANGCS|nr:unnamed protein product [Angiostrongylus costaricensis]